MEEQKKKGLEIRIGGRTIPMLLTTWEVIQIQEEIGCTVPQMWDQVFGIEHIMEDDGDKTVFHVVENKDMMRKLGMLIRICGNAGLEEAGQEPQPEPDQPAGSEPVEPEPGQPEQTVPQSPDYGQGQGGFPFGGADIEDWFRYFFGE